MNSSPSLSPPVITAALTRIAAMTPTMAQNSVVLNDALVSVAKRLTRAIPTAPSQPRGSLHLQGYGLPCVLPSVRISALTPLALAGDQCPTCDFTLRAGTDSPSHARAFDLPTAIAPKRLLDL